MREPIVFVNGLFWPQSRAQISVLDRGFTYGDGLFETLRAYRGVVFRLEDHLDRCSRSARLIFLELPMTRQELRTVVCETLKRNLLSDAIIRLTVTRGEQEPGLAIDPETPPTVVVHARPFEALPGYSYEKGVRVSLFHNSAPRVGGINSQIKSCNFLSQIVLRERARKEGVFEGIMIDSNKRIADGTTSNIFIVKNGILKTPALTEFVLPGVTRQVVLELAASLNISHEEQDLMVDDVYRADEVFLTNTRIEILPVQQADRQVIGTGTPGPVTRRLRALFLKTFGVSS